MPRSFRRAYWLFALVVASLAAMAAWYALRRRLGAPCDYDRPACARGFACALRTRDDARCVPEAVAPRPLAAPFAPGERFWCSQGPRSPRGRTHSFAGDIDAVDLVPSAARGGVEVRAPADGELVAFDGCTTERDDSPDAHNSSQCGLGYGNHVKIWDGTNLYLLGHLARVTVARGRVHRGEVVGIAGVSGAAGHRHVHLVVTQPGPGDELATILNTTGYKGRVPVRFALDVADVASGARRSVWIERLGCDSDRARGVEYLP